jgi:hypothetical protein
MPLINDCHRAATAQHKHPRTGLGCSCD